MIKKRSRPHPRIRETSSDTAQDSRNEFEQQDHEDESLPIADLLELRKLRRAKQGIDSSKLTKGDDKKRKKKKKTDEEEGGLKKGAVDDDDDEENQEAKARRVVRSNNFTQQTNALDVDKHMMAYIEENLKIRSKPRDEDDDDNLNRPADPQEELYRISDRWKVDKKAADEGNVTNSMAMLTAIPEVDLGMDTRLKNIEETEKAKRVVAEERQERKRSTNDEEHLSASRFYRPNPKQKSDAEILRDAKLEAMGIVPNDDQHRRPHHERTQMATDEMVMERFKKRMRK